MWLPDDARSIEQLEAFVANEVHRLAAEWSEDAARGMEYPMRLTASDARALVESRGGVVEARARLGCPYRGEQRR